MDFLKLTLDPLSVDEVTKLVGDPSCGAISLFIGTTRDNFEGKIVCKLEYEAYNEMAKKEMKKICEECRTKWSLKNIAIHHRLGIVGVKEASVIVAVSSVHRRESLDAVSFLIDALKGSVPIWKREVYADNRSEWKRNKECSWMNKDSLPHDGVKIKEEVMDTEDCVENVKTEPVEDEEGGGGGMDSQEMPKHYQINVDLQEEFEDKKEGIVDPSFIQIFASKEEMERRIRAFQERKKEELNVLNIQEFCMKGTEENQENSCARTTAVVLRTKGSSSHLKFTKVFNEWGPQTLDPGSIARLSNPSTLPKVKPMNQRRPLEHPDTLRSSINTASDPPLASFQETVAGNNIPEGIEERLLNMENHLKVHPRESVSPSIYSRLKALEDRILFLEGTSPEYFTAKTILFSPPNKMDEKRSTDDDMTLEEVDAKIFALRKYLKERQLGITL